LGRPKDYKRELHEATRQKREGEETSRRTLLGGDFSVSRSSKEAVEEEATRQKL